MQRGLQRDLVKMDVLDAAKVTFTLIVSVPSPRPIRKRLHCWTWPQEYHYWLFYSKNALLLREFLFISSSLNNWFPFCLSLVSFKPHFPSFFHSLPFNSRSFATGPSAFLPTSRSCICHSRWPRILGLFSQCQVIKQ